jgi:hypothetical protein
MMTLDMAEMEYDLSKKALTFYMDRGEAWPSEVEVVSHHTGRVIRFVYDLELAQQNDFWDGELTALKPTEECNVKTLWLVPCFR